MVFGAGVVCVGWSFLWQEEPMSPQACHGGPASPLDVLVLDGDAVRFQAESGSTVSLALLVSWEKALPVAWLTQGCSRRR